MKAHPLISESTFWDIDPETLDYESAADWVILRVFDRGSLQEVISVVKYYGKEKVKTILQTEKSQLPDHSILLARAFFQLKFSDFQCLKKKPFPKRFSMS